MAINFLSGVEKALGFGKKKPEDLLSPTTETGMMPAAPPVRPPALPAINAPASSVAPMSGLGARAEEILKMQPPGGVGAGPDLSGVGVDLPSRPWSAGMTPYSPTAQAKDQYMLKGSTPGQDGKPQFKRSWMDALKNAGIGFLQGAASNPENPLAAGLGGAAAGGVGTAISPMRGREYQFETLERPRIEAEQQRNQAWQTQLGKAAEAALGMRGLEARTQRDEFEARDQPARRSAESAQAAAELERTRASTEATKAGMKDASQERVYRQAQIDRILAQTKAAETGKPQQTEFVDPKTGKPVKALVYPDGRVEAIGGSVNAYVTEVRQSGANARAAQSQAGQNARAAAKAAAKGGGKSAGAAGPTIEGYMEHVKRKTGRIITADEARRDLQSRGIK